MVGLTDGRIIRWEGCQMVGLSDGRVDRWQG